MNGRYVERAAIGKTTSLAMDLANHIYARQELGRAIIVVDKPPILFVSLRKEWNKVIKAVLRERASTLDADLVKELTRRLDVAQSLLFTNESPLKNDKADVYMISPEVLLEVPISNSTVYLCSHLDTQLFDDFLKSVPPGCTVVDYESSNSTVRNLEKQKEQAAYAEKV